MRVVEYTVIVSKYKFEDPRMLTGFDYSKKGDRVKIYCKDFKELERLESMGLIDRHSRIVRVRDGIAQSFEFYIWYNDTQGMLNSCKRQPVHVQQTAFIKYAEKWIFPFFELYGLPLFRKMQSTMLDKLRVICSNEDEFSSRTVDAARAIVDAYS